MNKRKFSIKKVFSIVDGRLSTSMDDVYDILNHITGESLMTHQLPTALKYIKNKKPLWLFVATDLINKIKKEAKSDDFDVLMNYIDKMYSSNYVELPSLTEEQKEGFGKYMVENSLLLKLGKAKKEKTGK